MIITFCGHADFLKSKDCEEKFLRWLGEIVGEKRVEMYLGGYGNFDHFAYDCCKKYKETHPNVFLVFVTPYMTVEYQRNYLKYQEKRYDHILFPEIENKPKRFAITYRNRYMVDKADWIVAYVKHDWGGAYATYQYAKRKGKTIFNLADEWETKLS